MKATKPKAALISLISFSTNPTKAPSLQIIPTKIRTHLPNFCTYAHNLLDPIPQRPHNPNNFSPSFSKKGNFLNAHNLLDELPHRDVFSLNRELSSHIKNGSVDEAKSFFNALKNRNIVTWTIMIGALSDAGRFQESFALFHEMTVLGFVPDSVTIVTVLGLCTNQNSSIWALQIHNWIIKLGVDSVISVCNTLVDAYCKCGLVKSAQEIFQQMKERDSVTFNALLSGYSKNGNYLKALDFFKEMLKLGLKPSKFTFSGLLVSITGLLDPYLGIQIHCHVIKSNFVWDVFVNNSLLDFYSKVNILNDARNLFDEMPQKDHVSYNVMISSYSHNGLAKEAFELFHEMKLLKFDSFKYPFSSLISLAGNLANIQIGKQLHAKTIVNKIIISDDLVSNALIDMYSKCGDLTHAEIIFKQKSNKNAISWTAFITGQMQNGHFEVAIKLFCNMRKASQNPDIPTFCSVLKASSHLALIAIAEQFHSYLIISGFISSIFTQSALVDNYAKCGFLKEAHKVFAEMPERNIVSWNALICAYGQNGKGRKAIEMFESLIGSGFEPESVSFLSVLTACNHSGLVEEGLCYFDMMKACYNLEPKKEHYACMIDILGRTGKFGKLEIMLGQIPFEPDPIIWGSILNSCKIHGNYKLGKLACDKLFQMESKDAGHYLIMSNIYAKEGKWDQVARVKKLMRDRGVIKETAYSWVEINRKIYTFSSNDMRNPRISEIKTYLDKLSVEMEREGYEPDISSDQHLVGEKTKVEFLRYHSERLAIAFALIGTKDGEIIRVMKNLRTCVDCHEAIKIMTRVVKREIIVRDSSRFHHFKDGVCSCGDYW